MPVYVYQCKNCNHVFEQRQSFSDDALRICPQCGEETLRKRYTPVGVTFTGSGFYRPDTGTPYRDVPHPPNRAGGGNTCCPAPRRLRSTPDSEALHDIVTPMRRTLLTHPFQTLTLLRGQRLRGSSRSLRTCLRGTCILRVQVLSISFLRGSPRSRRGTRSHHRRRRHTHQQRLSPAHRAAAAHTAVTAARLRRRRITSHEPQRPHPYPGSAARAPPQRPDRRTPPGCPG